MDDVEVIKILKNSMSHINSSIPPLRKATLGLRGTRLRNGDLVVCGGSSASGKSDDYLHYKFGCNQWTQIGSMDRAKSAHSSVCMDGSLFTTGGLDSSGDPMRPLSYHEEFSMQGGVKERKAMPIALLDHTATEFGPHKMLVCGGWDENVSKICSK